MTWLTILSLLPTLFMLSLTRTVKTQYGSVHGLVFTTFERRFLGRRTNQTINRPQKCCEHIFIILFLSIEPVMRPCFDFLLTFQHKSAAVVLFKHGLWSPLTFQHKRAAVVPFKHGLWSPLTFQHKRAAVVLFKHGLRLPFNFST